jgi:hypothetical protein
MRELFALILLCGPPADPRMLWEKYEASFTDDYWRQSGVAREANPPPALVASFQGQALRELARILDTNDRKLKDFPGMPEVSADLQHDGVEDASVEIAQELRYDRAEQETLLQQRLNSFNSEQQAAYEAIAQAYARQEDALFFVDGGAGCGKTFLYGALLALARSQGNIALAVASSGIAAQLLPGGKTAHSVFKIPLPVDDYSTCSVSKQCARAELLRRMRMVVWDEAPMCDRRSIEAVDRTLRFIREKEVPFGGGVVVFGGDWRQILPVVRHGSRLDIVDATLQRSALWSRMRILRLSRNMRISREGGAEGAEWLHYVDSVGNATVATHSELGQDMIRLPEYNAVPGNTVESLIGAVFPDFLQHYSDRDWMAGRAILGLRTCDVEWLNAQVQRIVPGPLLTSYSADSMKDANDPSKYPVELLNTVSVSGMPPHKLEHLFF